MYNRLSSYYKSKYGEQVKKICIDGGFTCPNRDGNKGQGGCIFCNQLGSGEQILHRQYSVTKQIDSQLILKGDGKYIAYYQNYTNTYACEDVLKQVFLPAINNDKIVGLSIATRPDCINIKNVSLLKQLSVSKDVVIELGLQTANDVTANKINRCYKSIEFTAAVDILNKNNIDIVVHIILGLPNETVNDVKDTVRFLNKHNYSGIKIHSLYVDSGTVLANLYNSGLYEPISYENYVSQVVYVLTHINPNITVHRITGDGDKKTLLAPSWSKNKIKVINAINKHMIDNNLKQGCCFNVT